jgi:MFS family permease
MSASLVVLLALAHCMASIDQHLPSVAAPLLRRDLGLTDTQFGLLEGPAFAFLYVVGLLSSWPLARSAHRLRWLAACMGTWMLGMVAFALAHSLDTLMVARALVGLGQSAFLPLALGVIVDGSAPAWRARSIALFTAGSGAGRSLSMLLGGATLAALTKWMPAATAAHWRLMFVVMAAPNLVLMLLLLLRQEPPRASPPLPRRVFSRTLAWFAERPRAMGMYLCGAGVSILVLQTICAWAPSVLHREHGLTPASAALVFGVWLLIASPLGNALAGVLVDKRGDKLPPTTIMGGALLLVIPVLWVMPSAPSAMTACILLAFAALVSSTAAVVMLAGLPSLLSEPVRDMGLRLFLTFITVVGVALGPLMAGMVSDGLGIGGHGLSLALRDVCVGAAALGIFATALARGGRQQVALEPAQ